MSGGRAVSATNVQVGWIAGRLADVSALPFEVRAVADARFREALAKQLATASVCDFGGSTRAEVLRYVERATYSALGARPRVARHTADTDPT